MSSPIRVLQCGINADLGGIEALIMNLYNAIDRDVVQFDFLISASNQVYMKDEIERMGGICYPNLLSKRKGFLKAHNALKQVFEKKNWAAFHMNSTFKQYYQPIEAARCGGVKTVICHAHAAGDVFDFQKSAYFRAAAVIGQKKIVKHSTHLLACSENAGRYMFGEKSGYEVLKNGIEAKKFIYNESIRNRVRRELNLGDKFVVGIVARVSEAKNPYFILEIFRKIVLKNKYACLCWAGEGQNDSRFLKTISDMGLVNNVLLLNNRNDINELMQAFDVMLLPSLAEGLGIVCVEAQAAGLPIIVSEAIPEEANVTDLIVRNSLKNSAQNWADMALCYAGKKERPNTYSQITAAGYDISLMAKRLEEIYMRADYKNRT